MPGQDWKYPFWIAFKKVVMDGLKAHLCRYSARLVFVLSLRTIIFMDSIFGLNWSEMFTSHSPSWKFLFPLKISLFFLKTLKSNLSKTATHPSSHNFPIEIKDAFVSPLKTCAVPAVSDSDLGRGRRPHLSAWIWELSGRRTVGPYVIFLSSCSACWSFSVT